MPVTRPYVLSIAGFDPSGGAGILADIKTFESHKVNGLGVISANTFQNDETFEGVKWIPVSDMIRQIDILRKRFSFSYIKIGLIESMEVLEKIVSHCRQHFSDCKIIWDPILKASAGFEFHKEVKGLEKIAHELFCITPNMHEAEIMGGQKTAQENAKSLSQYCNVFLKGGHAAEKVGYDTIYLKAGKQFSFRPKIKNVHSKHGSGCVLSAALTANLAKGEKLHRACLEAKGYTEKFLKSNKTLLGYHKL
jgi:hydroxymethylpyrimidine/phosphomethylpyrimidine kinase